MALSQLEPFTVTSPPTDVTLGGYPGKHLELAVPALPIDHVGNNVNFFTGCVENELYSWISPLNDTAGPGSRTSGLLGHGSDSRGAFNIYQAVGDTEELWILDVEGTRVVIAAFTPAGSPTADIAERDAMFDSIRVEP
jgi:hypothetical protein